jgi:hypothetical protein
MSTPVRYPVSWAAEVASVADPPSDRMSRPFGGRSIAGHFLLGKELNPSRSRNFAAQKGNNFYKY